MDLRRAWDVEGFYGSLHKVCASGLSVVGFAGSHGYLLAGQASSDSASAAGVAVLDIMSV